MSSPKFYEDPTNRVVSAFDSHRDAVAARMDLVRLGFDEDEIRILKGDDAAVDVDTSAKWFADTDVEVKKFERELRHGNTILAIPIEDSERRDCVHDVLKSHGARQITHFGEWIVESMK